MKRLAFPAVVVALLGLWAGSVCAQEWIRTFDGGTNGDDELLAVSASAGGDVVVAGKLDRGDYLCGAVAMYTSAGERRWLTVYDPYPGFDSWLGYLRVDASGAVFAAGSCKESSAVSSLALLKLKPDGTPTHEFRYSHPDHLRDYARGLLLDRWGDVVVLGRSETHETHADMLVVKCDSACRPLWTTRFDLAAGTDWPNAIAVDSVGNIYVAGTCMASFNDEATLLKLEPNGDTSWTRTLSLVGESAEFLQLVILHEGVYPMGFYSIGRARALTARFTGDGDSVWAREMVHGAPLAAVAVDTLGVVHVDVADDSSALEDIRTFAYSPSGSLRWVRRYDGPAHAYDQPRAVVADETRGSIYVTGYSQGIGTRWDCTTICYDFAGDLQWLARHNGSRGDGHDAGTAMALDASGNIIVVGYETGVQSGKDWLVIKYPPTGPGVAERELGRALPGLRLTASPSPVSTRCEVSLENSTGAYRVSMTDVAGRTVRVLQAPAGREGERASVTWDTRDDAGQPVPNGVYFVSVAGSGACATAKVVVQR